MELTKKFNIESVKKTDMQKTKDSRDNFLKLNYSKNFTFPEDYKKKFFIYIIMNLTNKKIYVGKCKNLFDRANNYIWHVTNPNYHDFRPIIKALKTYGLENFVMFPIEACDNKIIAGERELFYIKSLNTTDRTIGYNESTTLDIRSSRNGQVGHEHTIDTKIKKGKPVLCINPDTKIAFIAVGMKIFADYMGTSKDLIKNCARRPCKYKGYYIIYLNDFDRDTILQKAIQREEAQIKKFQKYYDVMGESPLSKLPAYIDMVQCVERFMDNPSKAFFDNEGYDAHILTYETDPNSSITFKLEDIDEFFNV